MKKMDFPIENFKKFGKALGLHPSGENENFFLSLIQPTLSNISPKKHFERTSSYQEKEGVTGLRKRNGFTTHHNKERIMKQKKINQRNWKKKETARSLKSS
jgi:hypothetical protein